MIRCIKTSILLLFLLSFGQSYAQTDIQTLSALARQAKDNAEYEKAIGYFEELLKLTDSETYYSFLIELYPEVKDYKSAEKLIKKQIRKSSERPELLVDLGYIYELQNELKNAEKEYESAISEAGGNIEQSRSVANTFASYNKYKYAEKTYLKARKENNNEQLFRFELANVYAQQGKTSEMIEEYLNILGNNRSYIQTIQNIFQRVLHPDPEGIQMEKLKEQLLKKIQKNPNQEVYSELLMWLYIQDKNFNGAFIQAKALDKRLNENGKRLYSLGELSYRNKNFEVAEKSFQYIIDLGDISPYYLSAKMKLVEVFRAKVIAQENYEIEDLRKLQSLYENTIEELGKSAYTLELIRGLAGLNAYYLDSIDLATKQLEEAIQIKGIEKQEKAEIKIDLADLMLLKGEIWEASLLYSQVEKEFKYDRLGEIAKLKNAKIAFYTGDFYWAQAQLDVLKGSTSKLISNDAMELSLLITDNLGLDSISEPLEMYARADLLLFKKDFEEAEKTLDSIPKYFPASSLKDEVLHTKSIIAYQQRDYELAADYLEKLLAAYADDILGDNALFSLAKIYEEKLDQTEKAMELYKQLLLTYPSSLFVVESRKRYRALRGDKLEEETEEIN